MYHYYWGNIHCTTNRRQGVRQGIRDRGLQGRTRGLDWGNRGLASTTHTQQSPCTSTRSLRPVMGHLEVAAITLTILHHFVPLVPPTAFSANRVFRQPTGGKKLEAVPFQRCGQSVQLTLQQHGSMFSCRALCWRLACRAGTWVNSGLLKLCPALHAASC